MRVNDMARMQNFDVYKIINTSKNMPKSRDEIDGLLQADKYTPSNTPFIAPNWNQILSKSTPLMSDEEFEKAIWELGWKDAASDGAHRKNLDYANLMGAYISVVSPDRKAAYAHTMAQTGGKMPINKIIYDSDGRRLMNYNPGGFWLPRSSDEEKARLANFNRIFWEGFKAYEAEHGKVQT